MFKELKGGSVMLSIGGRYKTVNIAIHSSAEKGLYAKVNGNWYSPLMANGKTGSSYNWSHLHVPASHNRIENSALGHVQVECVATKVRKRLGVGQ